MALVGVVAAPVVLLVVMGMQPVLVVGAGRRAGEEGVAAAATAAGLGVGGGEGPGVEVGGVVDLDGESWPFHGWIGLRRCWGGGLWCDGCDEGPRSVLSFSFSLCLLRGVVFE